MADTLTYTVELLVGLACLGLAVPAWRRGRWLRLAALGFAVAGAAAAVHASTELLG